MEHRTHNSQIADYIDLIFDTFLELHGDRKSGDDETAIGGLARLDEYKVLVVGYQKDRTTETPKAPDAKGYRKCSRLMRLAEAFNKPVILLIDVPEPVSLSASEQQINEAIARNLEEMSCLMTPIIAVITGESTGGATIDMCAVDRVLMLESASFCISSFDSAATDMADSELCLKAKELQDLNLVNRVVKEPSAADLKSAAKILKEAILEELHQLTQVHPEVLVQERLQRLQYQFLNFETAKLPSGD
ncbi:carboxyl transferase domain-containing protein [Candidatus Poribacteria bacterium]